MTGAPLVDFWAARFHGYLPSIVSDLGADASELLILDAADLSQIVAVELPRTVPAGIHGSWIPDFDLV
jgi:carotenoid cleavage dioxygenase